METLLKLAQPRWTGHVASVSDERIPKKSPGELKVGKHSQGGQKPRYRGILKASLTDFKIISLPWEEVAHDRAKWRCLIRKEAHDYEAENLRR